MSVCVFECMWKGEKRMETKDEWAYIFILEEKGDVTTLTKESQTPESKFFYVVVNLEHFLVVLHHDLTRTQWNAIGSRSALDHDFPAFGHSERVHHRSQIYRMRQN